MMVNDRSISVSSVVAMNASIGQLICGDCDAVFSKQSSLSRHEKIHWAALRCGKDGCEKVFSSHKHLYKHLNRHSDTNLIVRIVPFNIRTKIEVKEELNDDDVSGGSPSVPHFIIKKEEEEGEFKVKIEVKEELTEKCNVQLCKRVKKEENNEGEMVVDQIWDGDECDCDECRVERMIKQEHDQTGEKEIDGNNFQENRDCVKDKKEEEEYDGSVNIEVKRSNKKQRIDKMTEKDPVPIGTSTMLSTVHSSKATELEDDRVDKFDETDDGELLTNGQIADNEVADGDDGDHNDDDTEVDEEYDENYEESEQMDVLVDEEYEDTEVDEESEQNLGVSNGKLVQLSAKSFVKRIEPDELGNRFECDYEGCGKRYKHKHHLTRNIRRHTGEMPFKCSWDNCCRAFIRKDKFNEHLNTHTGNCPFVCNWSGCNDVFKQRANFTRHTRIHLNDRRHRCDWPDCVQAFSDLSNLKVHRLIHTKERPFICNQCWVLFTRKTSLNNHYRSKHLHSLPFVYHNKESL